MKELFKWYFPQTPQQIKKIWKSGILTVDTNVLLDLYRYHQNTSRALLESLNLFKGRAWISHQVVDEFFRNRNRVILSSTTSFNEAEKYLDEIKKTIEESIKRLKSNRTIPDTIGTELDNDLEAALKKARGKIEQVKSKYPDYISKDPILENICELFHSSIGLPFDTETIAAVLQEAKRRKDNKIPPGFKDSNKEGDKPYGDYIIWRQILDFTKKKQKPLIFVTSEEKEDWWERWSGRTIGPLYDLLKEFHEETKQPLLLYRTARFLEYSSVETGKETNVDAVAEIRDIATQRLRETPLARVIEQKKIINNKHKACGQLIVELLEPAFKFTCSGHLEPRMSDIPILQINLRSIPSGMPKYQMRSGTGTTFDFHIHLKSSDFGTYLPLGQYVFEYDANVENIHEENLVD